MKLMLAVLLCPGLTVKVPLGKVTVGTAANGAVKT